MSFKLTNGSVTWQVYINNVLRKFLDVFIVVYLDDIVVYSKTKENHIQHVKQVFQTMKDAKLQIHPGKTIFHTQKIHFLGYIIMDKGLKMDSNKVKAICEWRTPMSTKRILLFLEFTGYYWKFVKSYSKIIALLIEITRKDIIFTWELKKQKAFDMLKEQLTMELILIIFDPTKLIMLETDTLDLVLGAVISQ